MGNTQGRDPVASDGYGFSVRSELRAHFGNANATVPDRPHLIPNNHVSERHEDGDDGRLSHVDSSESMGHSPPESPSSSALSPLMFSPQIPVVPIPRGDEAGFSPYPSCNYETQEDHQQEQGIPAIFQWTHGGDEVYLEGSWDNWRMRIRLQKIGNEFTIVKMLPSGVYQYKFLVNGESTYSPDLPFMYDERGNIKNVLDLQEHVPENLETISGFEAPRSPDTSYDSSFPTIEDFNKEPPLVPPQLHITPLDMLENVDAEGSSIRPQHVVLNHLYVEKGRTTQSALALGLTHRYHSKYVTVVLYKPLH